jgi:hypothetical protein
VFEKPGIKSSRAINKSNPRPDKLTVPHSASLKAPNPSGIVLAIIIVLCSDWAFSGRKISSRLGNYAYVVVQVFAREYS